MKKNKISKNWINRQRRDTFVRQSKVDGYRARSVYKLIEINEKFGIFKNDIGIFSIKFITFMVGSIAIGRLVFSALPSTPSFYSVYFLFEVITFFVGLLLLYIKKVKSSY